MQKGMYATTCENKDDYRNKDGCHANAKIIEKITQEDKSFCDFCLSPSNSNINVCVTLLKLWQTLLKVR